ncbi:MAG: HAMP domain-containing protein [Lachnospiraceae bacterium]|nr:HAMP domain-containing protein [Lachnospiraceae bacterium]
MKYSIKRQLITVFISILIGALLLLWFLNTGFLGTYYMQDRERMLVEAYSRLNEAANDGRITTDDFNNELWTLSNIYNISIVVIDADANLQQSSGIDANTIVSVLQERLFSSDESNIEKLEETDAYIMERTLVPHDEVSYLQMWGVLDNGNLFMIRTPVEGMKQNANIANRFLLIVALFVLGVGAVFILVVSGRISGPISSLTEISKEMAALNFDVHYEGNEKNEIGVLGQQMNVLSDTLEKTISELKTANAELTQDIKRKEEIDEMRKEFLSNVSHELKTPLALIMSYAEGLKENINQDEESRDFYCDVIIDEAGKMDGMVKQLLALNQLEFGQEQISMEHFNLTELILGHLSSSKILFEQDGITPSLTIRGTAVDPFKTFPDKEDTVLAWGDSFKIEEVFTNYMSNAIHYAGGEKRIEIAVTVEEDKVRVTVFNTGTQIPEESLGRVFEKFYKVDKARTREYGGSGVGLSIVKAIMDLHGQAFGVYNRDDGVAFFFELAMK